ncbi:MAG: DUF116 domain-containing protein [bacterium]|nr:DUF116 domain-containing protein [bacterium]
MEEASVRPKKRIFVGLMSAAVGALLALGVLFWVVIKSIGLSTAMIDLLTALLIVFLALMVITAAGVVLLVLTLFKGREILSLSKMRGLIVKVIYPLTLFLGTLFRIPKDKIQKSFVEVNNQLVLARKYRIKHNRLLLLMPHCIQYNECRMRVTGDIQNCARCGLCRVSDLIDLKEQYGVDIFVATGGTLARRLIEEKRPQAVVAVACKRDLTSGIVDSYPLPVLGILNERPVGPCITTIFDLEKVREAIRHFVAAENEVHDGVEAPLPRGA